MTANPSSEYGFDIVAISASAGGIEPIRDLLRQLPRDLPAAILIVVHRPLEHARYADLTIVGQVNSENAPAGAAAHLPERLALASGRPVLIVPYVGHYKTIGARVLVAWNRTREAVRAVNDALPMLQLARQVIVLSINPEQGEARSNPPGADVARHLARHGSRSRRAIRSQTISRWEPRSCPVPRTSASISSSWVAMGTRVSASSSSAV